MQVHVSKDPNDLNCEAAEWMTTLIETTLYQQDRFCLLLSGGNTRSESGGIFFCASKKPGRPHLRHACFSAITGSYRDGDTRAVGERSLSYRRQKTSIAGCLIF
jgi:hypothetical protein